MEGNCPPMRTRQTKINHISSPLLLSDGQLSLPPTSAAATTTAIHRADVSTAAEAAALVFQGQHHGRVKHAAPPRPRPPRGPQAAAAAATCHLRDH